MQKKTRRWLTFIQAWRLHFLMVCRSVCVCVCLHMCANWVPLFAANMQFFSRVSTIHHFMSAQKCEWKNKWLKSSKLLTMIQELVIKTHKYLGSCLYYQLWQNHWWGWWFIRRMELLIDSHIRHQWNFSKWMKTNWITSAEEKKIRISISLDHSKISQIKINSKIVRGKKAKNEITCQTKLIRKKWMKLVHIQFICVHFEGNKIYCFGYFSILLRNGIIKWPVKQHSTQQPHT